MLRQIKRRDTATWQLRRTADRHRPPRAPHTPLGTAGEAERKRAAQRRPLGRQGAGCPARPRPHSAATRQAARPPNPAARRSESLSVLFAPGSGAGTCQPRAGGRDALPAAGRPALPSRLTREPAAPPAPSCGHHFC